MTTQSLWINILLFVVGLVVLVKGSDWFIDAAAFIAKRLNVPDMIIGLTLVSIGTSLPELAANVCAAMQGKPEVAMGVIPGSNVANVLLVLGVSVVCMRQIPVTRLMFNRDTMVMSGVYLIFCVMCYAFPMKNGQSGLGRIEAGILLVVFVAYMFILIRRKEPGKEEEQKEEEKPNKIIRNIPLALIVLVAAGALVVFGAQAMVDNVVWIAEVKLRIPVPIITATVVAFGTSVPELAVTLAGIIKKKSDIALGNIVGSSIFNLIFVMGITGLVAEVPVQGEVATLILPFMLGSGAALVIFMRSSWALVRWEGVVMVLGYLGYIGANIYTILAKQ